MCEWSQSCILPGPERGGGRVGIVPWHQVGSVEGLAEFVDSFVHGSSRLADVHEEVFADRFYPVEAGLYVGICRNSSLVAVNGTHGDHGREDQVYERKSRSSGSIRDGSGSGDICDQELDEGWDKGSGGFE